MSIPQLLKKNKSQQDWRRPVILAGHKNFNSSRHKDNFSLTRRYRQSRHSRKKTWRRALGIILPIFIFLILLGGILAVASLAWISKDLPNPDKVINRSITVSTKIYDRTGETVLYDIHGDIKRTLIDLKEIPEHVKNATLAAEDRDFYRHKGFSLTGIARSVIRNLTTGSRVGGSTLTQQFVKNAILTSEKTYTRKIKELLISYQLEKKFSKDQILQMYFNEIPYGSVIYGVEAAAQTFFGKSARDLTIAEGAVLAAIPKAPTYYSPYGNNKDKLIVRQRYIIDSMSELGYISAEQAEQAKNEKIIFNPFRESIIAPHFVMYVRELLTQEYGESFITQEGLKVYTSLDLEKQRIAEEAVKRGVAENGERYSFNNASLVAIDPKTGQILAMVGSVNYFNNEIDGQVNVSLRPRQPGSSFKPIVYTAAFIKGYTPNTILYDVVTDFDTTGRQKYKPKNYDLKEHGPVTIRKALAGSLNIPAVKTTYLTGINNVLDLADDFGYTTLKDRSRFGLSIVLGGGEVKLLEHVGAFATLAQEGIKHEIAPILKIEDKNGRIIYQYKDRSKQIIEPEITRLTTDILADNESRSYIFGATSNLVLPNRPAAVKTGTTNNYRDAWTVGYTPNLAAGVWVGNNNNDEMRRGADGSIVAAPIWNQFMREALKDVPPENFNPPEEIITGKPVLDGQETGEIIIKIDSISGKLATPYTPASTIKEIVIKEVHNILYYINRDDPLGDHPQNPTDDPQFYNWEEPVLNWAGKQGFDLEKKQIPTEYDDIHLPADQPQLIIITPLPNQTIKENPLIVEASATARRGIRKIEYYINNQLKLVKSDDQDAILDISNLSNGYHTLKVLAKDDLENTASQSIEINILLPQITPILNWISPNNNSEVNFPLKLEFNLINWQRIKKIDFYAIKEGGIENYITSIEPDKSNISLIWSKKPDNGNYYIYGNIFDFQNKKYKSEELKIIIK